MTFQRRLPSHAAPSSGKQRGSKMHSTGGRTLEEVKRVVSISQVIGAFISLTPAGIASIGLCPFVTEKTASFHVYEDEKKWKCYSCGAGGDVFDFVEKMQSCTLREALNFLEERYFGPVISQKPAHARAGDIPSSHFVPGQPLQAVPSADISAPDSFSADLSESIESLDTLLLASHPALLSVPSDGRVHVTPEMISANPQLQHVMDRALAAYVAGLRNAQPVVKAYALYRGITPELARQLQVGYSSGFTLSNALRTHPEERTAAKICELINERNHDRLASRLIIPEIRDGHAIFFIGRSIDEPSTPVPTLFTRNTLLGTPRSTRAPLIPFPGVEVESEVAGQSAEIDLSTASTAPTAANPGAAEGGTLRRNKYILVGPRLILGLGRARELLAAGPIPGVLVVEGAIDWAVTHSWQLPLPVLSTLGTNVSRIQLRELVSFVREASKQAGHNIPVVIGLDSNPEGQRAIPVFEEQLAQEGVLSCRLPSLLGGEDLGDLGKSDADPAGVSAFMSSLATLLVHLMTSSDPFPASEGDQGEDLGGEPGTGRRSWLGREQRGGSVSRRSAGWKQ